LLSLILFGIETSIIYLLLVEFFPAFDIKEFNISSGGPIFILSAENTLSLLQIELTFLVIGFEISVFLKVFNTFD
tara:strand:- start:134 stop:358 length:225 start_codon:yes stop_codon:yes gene_type:complete